MARQSRRETGLSHHHRRLRRCRPNLNRRPLDDHQPKLHPYWEDGKKPTFFTCTSTAMLWWATGATVVSSSSSSLGWRRRRLHLSSLCLFLLFLAAELWLKSSVTQIDRHNINKIFVDQHDVVSMWLTTLTIMASLFVSRASSSFRDDSFPIGRIRKKGLHF